jgi:hypothetical protein
MSKVLKEYFEKVRSSRLRPAGLFRYHLEQTTELPAAHHDGAGAKRRSRRRVTSQCSIRGWRRRDDPAFNHSNSCRNVGLSAASRLSVASADVAGLCGRTSSSRRSACGRRCCSCSIAIASCTLSGSSENGNRSIHLINSPRLRAMATPRKSTSRVDTPAQVGKIAGKHRHRLCLSKIKSEHIRGTIRRGFARAVRQSFKVVSTDD